MQNLGWIDAILLILILISTAIGLWRGLIREALSLAAWIGAFVLAFTFAGTLAEELVTFISVPEVRFSVAFGSLFLGTLFLGGVVGIVVSLVLKRTGLSGTDRLLGMAFGAVRGVAFVAFFVLLIGLTPLPAESWWQDSTLLPYFELVADLMIKQLPPDLAAYFVFDPEPSAMLPSAPPIAPNSGGG